MLGWPRETVKTCVDKKNSPPTKGDVMGIYFARTVLAMERKTIATRPAKNQKLFSRSECHVATRDSHSHRSCKP